MRLRGLDSVFNHESVNFLQADISDIGTLAFQNKLNNGLQIFADIILQQSPKNFHNILIIVLKITNFKAEHLILQSSFIQSLQK